MKIVDFIAGVVVLFMGVLPFLAKIAAVAENLALIKEPGTIAYQAVLIIVGVLLILYATREERK